MEILEFYVSFSSKVVISIKQRATNVDGNRGILSTFVGTLTGQFHTILSN